MIDTHISILFELKRTVRVNLSAGFLDYHPTQCDICSATSAQRHLLYLYQRRPGYSGRCLVDASLAKVAVASKQVTRTGQALSILRDSFA